MYFYLLQLFYQKNYMYVFDHHKHYHRSNTYHMLLPSDITLKDVFTLTFTLFYKVGMFYRDLLITTISK